MRSAWILFTLAALAAAQTTTVHWLGLLDSENNYDVDPSMFKSLAARVAAIDKTATTYEVRCASGVEDGDCGIKSDKPMTLIQGPNTFSVSIGLDTKIHGVSASLDGERECSFTHSSEHVSCTLDMTLSASAQGESTSTAWSFSSSDIPATQISYYPLTVTDGVYAFTADATASATAVKITATGGAVPMATAAPLGAAAMAAVAALL